MSKFCTQLPNSSALIAAHNLCCRQLIGWVHVLVFHEAFLLGSLGMCVCVCGFGVLRHVHVPYSWYMYTKVISHLRPLWVIISLCFLSCFRPTVWSDVIILTCRVSSSVSVSSPKQAASCSILGSNSCYHSSLSLKLPPKLNVRGRTHRQHRRKKQETHPCVRGIG